jgi:hypothetical protein
MRQVDRVQVLPKSCPKCGHDGEPTAWRGPWYTQAVAGELDCLTYLCNGCSYCVGLPCLDVR